jgi:membrane-anchored protein YejM (alkaline phosphatase superfamily)
MKTKNKKAEEQNLEWAVWFALIALTFILIFAGGYLLLKKLNIL